MTHIYSQFLDSGFLLITMLRQYKGFVQKQLEIPLESSSQLTTAAEYAAG